MNSSGPSQKPGWATSGCSWAPLDGGRDRGGDRGPSLRSRAATPRYRLKVEPGLAQAIADDLLEAGFGSALSPPLGGAAHEALARGRWHGRQNSPRELYNRLRAEGILLKDILDNGLMALKDWHSELGRVGPGSSTC